MKKLSTAFLVFCSLFFLVVTISRAHAVTAYPRSVRFPMRHGNIPSLPFSGIVEGRVFAISPNSITIDKKTYRGKNATSTEVTFIMESQVRINADQAEYVTSSMADISIGSSVSLVIERVGKDVGKVREIQLQSGL